MAGGSGRAGRTRRWAGRREGARTPEARTVEQAVGVDHSPLPGEFRDAIESYHRALEQSTLP